MKITIELDQNDACLDQIMRVICNAPPPDLQIGEAGNLRKRPRVTVHCDPEKMDAALDQMAVNPNVAAITNEPLPPPDAPPIQIATAPAPAAVDPLDPLAGMIPPAAPPAADIMADMMQPAATPAAPAPTPDEEEAKKQLNEGARRLIKDICAAGVSIKDLKANVQQVVGVVDATKLDVPGLHKLIAHLTALKGSIANAS